MNKKNELLNELHRFQRYGQPSGLPDGPNRPVDVPAGVHDLFDPQCRRPAPAEDEPPGIDRILPNNFCGLIQHPFEFLGRDRPPLHVFDTADFDLLNTWHGGQPTLQAGPVECRQNGPDIGLHRVGRTGPIVAPLHTCQQLRLQTVEYLPVGDV